MDKQDKLLLRALAGQLLMLAITGSTKADRYAQAAQLCREVADRLDEKAAEPAPN